MKKLQRSSSKENSMSCP